MTEMAENKTYLCIDLKSFFASVECVECGLDPLCTNLVVADAALTEKTICLAVSPALKKYGIGGRARLFEVVQMLKQANARRRFQAPKRLFEGSSSNAKELDLHPEYQIDYIIAPPRMAKYMEYSTKIYNIYLKYVAPEDIHAYSIDEVFVDITQYLILTGFNAYEFAGQMIKDVLKTTGITATAGIGTNLYLAKIAMDIEAKHIKADSDGVRIAMLIDKNYGIIAHSQIFGELVHRRRKSLNKMECLQWEMWQGVLLVRLISSIMKNCCTDFLVLMQSL